MSQAKEVCFGGARGGGKTTVACAKIMSACLLYPRSSIYVVRRYNKDIEDSIWRCFFNMFGSSGFIKNSIKNPLKVETVTDSTIRFLGIDAGYDKNLERIRSVDLSGVVIEEASQVSFDVYLALIQLLRLKTELNLIPKSFHDFLYKENVVKFDEHTQKYYLHYPKFIWVLTNPENCWIYDYFILQKDTKDKVFIQSLITDNYDENDEYVLMLKEAFKDSPNMYDRMILGKWEFPDKPNQLYSNELIDSLNRKIQKKDNNKYLGVDIAGATGGDRTVFTILSGEEIEDYQVYRTLDLPGIAEKIAEFAKVIPQSNIALDVGGIGLGVQKICERYYGLDKLIFFNSASKAINNTRYVNLKAQSYFQLAEDLRNDNLFFSDKINSTRRRELESELASIIYLDATKNKGKFGILDKDQMRVLMHKSPDIAESLIYANWARFLKTNRNLPVPKAKFIEYSRY